MFERTTWNNMLFRSSYRITYSRLTWNGVQLINELILRTSILLSNSYTSLSINNNLRRRNLLGLIHTQELFILQITSKHFSSTFVCIWINFLQRLFKFVFNFFFDSIIMILICLEILLMIITWYPTYFTPRNSRNYALHLTEIHI